MLQASETNAMFGLKEDNHSEVFGLFLPISTACLALLLQVPQKYPYNFECGVRYVF